MLQQLTALRLSGADWIFSIKAFVSAMLALYVAFRFDMQSQKVCGSFGQKVLLSAAERPKLFLTFDHKTLTFVTHEPPSAPGSLRSEAAAAKS